MKKIIVGLISGGSRFSKEISGRSRKEIEKNARKYLRENTLPGTSSRATIWFGDGEITRIKIKVPIGSTPKCVLKKRSFLY